MVHNRPNHMDYPELRSTINFVTIAHAGQLDMAGESYRLHCHAVAENLPFGRDPRITIDEVHAAYMHDIVEDTDYTLADIKLRGYNDRVVHLVDQLTIPEAWIKQYGSRKAEDRYMERFYESDDYGLLRVKLSDVEHNLDIRRNAHQPKIQKWAMDRYWPRRQKLLTRMFAISEVPFII